MISNIDFDKADRIIELGPGNGKITVELLNHMRKDTALYAFEINKAFSKQLQVVGDSRLKVFNKSAEYINEIEPGGEKNKKTYIVSSIPFGILPEAECDRIMNAIQEISDSKTVFIQYSYSIIQYRRFKKYFRKVRVQFELFNIPPAFIFVCRK